MSEKMATQRMYITSGSRELVNHMTYLELWDKKDTAALFLAAWARARGLDPVPESDMETDDGRKDSGEIGNFGRFVVDDDLAELVLLRGLDKSDVSVFKWAKGEFRGLVEAGARDLRPILLEKDGTTEQKAILIAEAIRTKLFGEDSHDE